MCGSRVARITAGQETWVKLIASPIPGNSDNLAANRYHAHVEMPAAFDPFHHYLTAMHLKTIFERHYHFESISKKSQDQSARPSLLTRLARWVGQMLAKIVRK